MKNISFYSVLAYMSCTYSEALVAWPVVLYIPYAKSCHKQTNDIITFAQFEEGNLVGNRRNLVEYGSVLASIDESSADNNSDDKYISTDYCEDIWYGIYVHPYIHERDSRLKVRDRIRQAQNEWKGA